MNCSISQLKTMRFIPKGLSFTMEKEKTSNILNLCTVSSGVSTFNASKHSYVLKKNLFDIASIWSSFVQQYFSINVTLWWRGNGGDASRLLTLLKEWCFLCLIGYLWILIQVKLCSHVLRRHVVQKLSNLDAWLV